MDDPTAHIGSSVIRLLRADITGVQVDAIVNAANQHLAGGGGVDGAIHRAGGPQIMAELRSRYTGCPTGDAVPTSAGNLPARFVIHAVAPRWKGGGNGEPELLASAYRRSLEVADELEARTVAFPSLGTGAYGYPVAAAARVAMDTVYRYLHTDTRIQEVLFVLFSAHDLEVYSAALARTMSGS